MQLSIKTKNRRHQGLHPFEFHNQQYVTGFGASPLRIHAD
jgi:hypothetical protein